MLKKYLYAMFLLFEAFVVVVCFCHIMTATDKQTYARKSNTAVFQSGNQILAIPLSWSW